MKKVAILTERLKDGFGVDLVVREQARLLKKNFSVTVFAVEVDQKVADSEAFNIEQISIPLSFNPIKQDLLSIRRYKSYKKKLSEFDTFIIQTPTFNSWIPLLSRIGRVVVYYHGNSPSTGYGGLKKYRQTIFNVLEQCFYFFFADKIITISNYLYNELPPIHRRKTVVIHHGADHMSRALDQLTQTQRVQIQKQYCLKKWSDIVTYIGRLDFKNNPYKNTQDLFTIKDKLDSVEKGNYQLFAIGFPENNIEEAFHSQQISVLPKATIEELVTVLQESAVYVSPSKWEGFNLPLLEAQSLGIPVVAYDRCAHPEVVGKKSGYLVQNSQELAKKVLLLLEDKQLRKKLSKEATLFASRFTWERNVKELSNHL